MPNCDKHVNVHHGFGGTATRNKSNNAGLFDFGQT